MSTRPAPARSHMSLVFFEGLPGVAGGYSPARAALRPPRIPQDLNDGDTIRCGPPDTCIELARTDVDSSRWG